MRVLDFSVWLRDESLFCGGVGIKVVVCAQGGLLGAGFNVVFVCDSGVLQGALDRNS